MPVSLNHHFGKARLPPNVHSNLSALNHGDERLNDFLNVVVNRFQFVILHLEFVLFNLHSLNLVLVVVPHNLARKCYCVYNIYGVFVLCLEFIFALQEWMVIDCVIHREEPSASKFAVHQYAVERSHLLVAVISLNSILVHIVVDLLLIFDDLGDVVDDD